MRVHAGPRAAESARVITARAYTLGSNVVFGAGQYAPGSADGRKLLAHELTHVVQSGSERIRRVPNLNPPPEPYIEGRPAHNHPPRGNWSEVQANAGKECSLSSLRGRVECACAIMQPLTVLAFSRSLEMYDKPLAKRHLEHYLSGGGVDYLEHTNLDNLMKNDAGARSVIADAIVRADRGQVFIEQEHYRDQNYRYSFGGIDRVDYKVDRTAGKVDVWFKDRFDFHPAGFGHANMGTGDYAPPGRPTNCVHAAAVEAKSSGAADFWMIGHATLPLSLFSSAGTDPNCVPAAGLPPTSCSPYEANSWWLPAVYVNNATCACSETPNEPTANCVRKFLQDRLAATPATLKGEAARMKKLELPAYAQYQAYVQDKLTPRIYQDHVDAYKSCCCPAGPAAYPAWIGVTSVPLPCSAVGWSIREFGSCHGTPGRW